MEKAIAREIQVHVTNLPSFSEAKKKQEKLYRKNPRPSVKLICIDIGQISVTRIQGTRFQSVFGEKKVGNGRRGRQYC